MQVTQPLKSSTYLLFKLLIACIGIIYIVNCFTPLHIHVDTIRYYNLKDCLQSGCSPDSFAARDYLPYGYTSLLILLSRLGILTSFSVIFINCLYLLGGLYFVTRIFRTVVPTPLLIAIIVFNWVVIKFVMYPLSEIQYVFFSSACLYTFHVYRQTKDYKFLGAAIICCLLSILTRTVGIALVPALVLSIAWEKKDGIMRVVRKNKIFIPLIGLMVLALFMRQLKILDYTILLKDSLKDGLWNFLATNFENHFTELTEIFVNIPSKKVLLHLPHTAGPAMFVAAGVLFFLWLMYVTFSKRNIVPFHIRIYLLCYALIILNWPYYDPRFWAPVLPFMAATIVQIPLKSEGFLKRVGKVWLAAYMICGTIAAAYSIYVGFDKERFSQNQANGVYRNEYEIYFFGRPQSDTAVHKDQNVIDILKKYD